jgi:hypothetical protein
MRVSPNQARMTAENGTATVPRRCRFSFPGTRPERPAKRKCGASLPAPRRCARRTGHDMICRVSPWRPWRPRRRSLPSRLDAFADLEPDEAGDLDPGLFRGGGDGQVGVHHELLVQKRDLGQELLHPAFDHLLDHRSGLPLSRAMSIWTCFSFSTTAGSRSASFSEAGWRRRRASRPGGRSPRRRR